MAPHPTTTAKRWIRAGVVGFALLGIATAGYFGTEAWQQHRVHATAVAQRDARLTALRQRAVAEDADCVALWQEFAALEADYPDWPLTAEVRALRDTVRARRNEKHLQAATVAYAALEQLPEPATYEEALVPLDRFLADYHDTPLADPVRKRQRLLLQRIDDRDIGHARFVDAVHADHFLARCEAYRLYLRQHPQGAYAEDARQRIVALEAEWDRTDFRKIVAEFQLQPAAIQTTDVNFKSYLVQHPQGKYHAIAQEILRWNDRITHDGEYRVILRRGDFDHKVAAHWGSRGPSLCVEIEVNGIKHGPSNIVTRRYDPDWDYEFPRRIRWKLGDVVRIKVTDHYYWNRVVLESSSDQLDAVGMRLLSGEWKIGPHTLWFESDFTMPNIPTIE